MDAVPALMVHGLFGESGDAVPLGLTALEQLGPAVDPVQRRFVTADFLLY